MLFRPIGWLLRRVFWIGTGVSVGFGGAMWIRRRIQQTIERYAPERLTRDVTGGVRRVGSSIGHVGTGVRDAVLEGRSAMHTREAELRRDLAPKRP